MQIMALEGCVHFSCHKSIASQVNAKWAYKFSDPYMPTYKFTQHDRMHYHCDRLAIIPAIHIPLIIQEFKKDDVDPLPTYYEHAVFGRTCIVTGECMLMDVECSVRCLIYKSLDGTYGVETYFIKNDRGRKYTNVIAYMFCYISFNKANQPIDSCFVNCPKQMSINDAIIELLSLRQHRAAQLIKYAYHRAKYTPTFKFCGDLLCKDLANTLTHSA